MFDIDFDILNNYSDKIAIIHNNSKYFYKDILANYYQYLNELTLKEVKNNVVSFECDYSPQSISLLLALIQNQNIIVPFSSVTNEQKESYSKIAFIEKEISFNNNALVVQNVISGCNDLIQSLKDISHPGLILFTSGSTGVPKAVLHDFEKLLTKYSVRRKAFCTITFLLLDHIGGINTLFHTLFNGGTIVTTQNRNPDFICKLIEDHKVELLPVSPSFLNLLILSESYKNHNLSSLKIISYGTEVMPQSLLNKLNLSLPSIQLRQTYGLSELGIMSTKSQSSNSLWLQVGGEGFQTKIVDNILYIKAASAMLGYLNAPNPFDSDGWFNTQDRVEIDGDFIKILGRDSEIINVGGIKVYPAEVEDIILQMPNIKDVIVKSEKNILLGNIVTAKVNLFDYTETPNSIKKKIQNFCKDKLDQAKIPIKVEITNDTLYNSRYKRIRR